MDTGILHTHTLVVTLYMLQLLVKVILLLAGNTSGLEKFSKKIRIAHMVLATLMLATGGFLLVRTWEVVQPYMWIKLTLVFASIPLGVVGVSKKNSMLALASLLCMGGAMGLAFAKPAIGSKGTPVVSGNGGEMTPAQKGEMVFTAQNCQSCHGADGNLGFQGAKPLGQSTLSDEEMKTRIKEGKGVMPANSKVTEEELGQLVQFIRSMKK